jgi:hypothetical protein
VRIVRLDTTGIVDESSFHRTFKDLFGFPEYYGANMDAWIELMSELDDPSYEAGLKLEFGETLTLEVYDTEGFASRTPDIFRKFVLCTSFVNQEYVRRVGVPIVSLVFL